MDVGIIAASLIVMRPCLKAIRENVVKRCHFPRIPVTHKGSQSTLSRVSGSIRDKGIVRTVDFELESQQMSTRVVTPNDLL